MVDDGLNVAIIGSGSFAKESYWTALRYFTRIGIGIKAAWLVADQYYSNEIILDGLPLIKSSELTPNNCSYLIWGHQEPESRKNNLIFLLSQGFTPSHFVMIADESADFADGAEVGKGSMVFPRAYVGPDVVLGDHVTIGPGAILASDTKIGDYSSICHGVAIGQNCRIGSCVRVGMGAIILPGSEIGEMSWVAPGARVSAKIPARSLISADGAISKI